MSQTLRRRADPKRKMDWFCVFVMATRKMHALVQVHLTTANQSEICVAYLALCPFWRRAYRVWKMNRQIMVEFFIMNETMIFAQKSDEKRQL